MTGGPFGRRRGVRCFASRRPSYPGLRTFWWRWMWIALMNSRGPNQALATKLMAMRCISNTFRARIKSGHLDLQRSWKCNLPHKQTCGGSLTVSARIQGCIDGIGRLGDGEAIPTYTILLKLGGLHRQKREFAPWRSFDAEAHRRSIQAFIAKMTSGCMEWSMATR